MEQDLESNRNGVEMVKSTVEETMGDEEVKKGNEVAEDKNLKFAKKVTVHFVSKGRGVTEIKKDRDRVKDTSDSSDTGPFLTIESGDDSARLSCVRKMNEPASHRNECETSASPVPMDGEW